MRNFHDCLYVSTIYWRRLSLGAIQMIAPKRPLFHIVAALLAALIIGFASTPGRATIHCEGNECSCIGDDDCNTLFGGGVCTNSGGSCSGSGSTAACTCTKKANVSQTKAGATPRAHTNLQLSRSKQHLNTTTTSMVAASTETRSFQYSEHVDSFFGFEFLKAEKPAMRKIGSAVAVVVRIGRIGRIMTSAAQAVPVNLELAAAPDAIR